MIKKLFFMVAVLLPTLAYGGNPNADLSVQIVPATAPAIPAVPTEAQAAGFTTLAANYDFTQPLPSNWIGCYPPDGNVHQWYAGYWYRDDIPPCNQSINLVQDSMAGTQVLDMTWKASFGGMDQGYTELQTISHDSAHVTDFPPNVYIESVFRVQTTPNITGTQWAEVGGSWWDLYTWPTLAANSSPTPGIEMDNFEDHGDFPTYLDISGWFNWAKGGCPNCGAAFAGTKSGFDPRQYHTIGMRVTSDGSTAMAICGYLDGAFQGCSNVKALDSAGFNYRNFLILINGVGCNYYAGDNSCQNATITNVYSCPAPFAGQICITPRTSSGSYNGAGHYIVEPFNNPTAYVSGVTGVPANGTWTIQPLNPNSNSDWVLNGSTFSGSYAGGGTLNPYTQTDMYIKYVRVWSCADWKTTMCNETVLTGAP